MGSLARPGALVLLVLSACGSGAEPAASAPVTEPAPVTAPPSPAGPRPLRPATPREATIVLDETRAVAGRIGRAGGALTLELEGGVRVTLEIPARALPSPAVLRLVPVASAAGLPLSGGLSAAVQLEPEGIVFLRPATLSFAGAGGLPASSGTLRSVGWSGAGANVHGRVHRRVEGGVALTIAHASGYAVGGESAEDAAAERARSPSGAEEQASADALSIFDRIANRQASDPDARPTPEEEAELERILRRWWTDTVREQLIAAEGDASRLTAAISEYLAWWSACIAWAFEERFAPEQREAHDRLAAGLRHALERAAARCAESHAIEEVGVMLQWIQVALALGLSDRPGLSVEDNRARLEECLDVDVEGRLRLGFADDADLSIDAELGIEDLELHVTRAPATGDTDVPLLEGSGDLSYPRLDVEMGRGSGCVAAGVTTSPGAVDVCVDIETSIVLPDVAPSGAVPFPYPTMSRAEVEVRVTRAPVDHFIMRCEDVPMALPGGGALAMAGLHCVTATSVGDEPGVLRETVTRQAVGPSLFQVAFTRRAGCEGEPVHLEGDLRLEHGGP